jgi:hypothetical protein
MCATRAVHSLWLLVLVAIISASCSEEGEGSRISGGDSAGRGGGGGRRGGGTGALAGRGGGSATGGFGGTGFGGAGGSGAVDGSVGSGGTIGGAGIGGAAATDGGVCANSAECNNGAYCDGVETCVNGTCVPGTAVVCPDDGKSCTKESCSEATLACERVPLDSACQDTLFCNGVETCNPAAPGANPTTGCVPGTAVVCADGRSCTDDSCDETTRACKYFANNANCRNTTFCDGDELCDPASGNPTTGCRAGPPRTCDDGYSCTTDTCDETSKACVNTPVNSRCTNGLFCDGQEICGGGPPPSGCRSGNAIFCPPDAIACTVEACDEAAQTSNPTLACKTVPDNSRCAAGEFCSPTGCAQAPACSSDGQCNDNNGCNGVETCDLSIGRCRFGTPMNCNDNIGCTLDSCAAPGVCSHTPLHSACDDANPCNGSETCGASGCVPGAALNCNDNVTCTTDTCLPSSGCVYTADHSTCQDTSFCNGAEFCDPTFGCRPGTAVTCPPDGVACTTEQCSEAGQRCVSVPDHTKCPCGQQCNVQQGGCGQFCTPATCQGKTYQCGDCTDNDGDCTIDAADSHCLGACQNNEAGFFGAIPGQNNAPCKADCYFDQDTGSGNDDCYWSHECDPLEVAPNYPPEGSKCAYNANASIPGTSMNCAQAFDMQSSTCLSICGPLTPNGCDCFGCCAIPGAPTTVWLGSLNASGQPSCTLSALNDPSRCKPCTQVKACINTCELCEICVGKPVPPPSCDPSQQCPAGVQPCGLPGQAPCATGYFCVTGCCQPVPGR